MFALENISITFSSSPFFFITGILIISFFTYYIYKYTIPQISKPKKTFLIILRSLSMVLLLFLIFEPILTITKKITVRPSNLIFVDNSKSMSINNENKDIVDFLESLKGKTNIKFFSFGANVNSINPDSLNKIKTTEPSTNFEKIFKKINEMQDDISSLTIISDGNITDGLSPVNESEELNFPIYTVGIGNTSTNKDVLIKKVSYNKFIYANTPTTISTVIENEKLNGSKAIVTLFDGNKIVERKNIILSKDGINNVSFTYKPDEYGDRKLKIRTAPLPGEGNKNNNSKIFYIKVQKSKLKILIIAGSPSNDLSIIKSSLKDNKNLIVNSLTQITNNRFLEKENVDKLLDSSDVYFLIGFPSSSSSISFIEKVKARIIKNKKPFLFLLGNSIDTGKLNYLNDILSFKTSFISSKTDEVLPSIVKENINSPILQTQSNDVLSIWSKLPPVFQPNADYKVKPGSNVLSEIIINNIPLKRPLIITRKIAGSKSISILAGGIYRWKLLAAANGVNMFDKFISDCVKWLNASDKEKRVIIKPVKKLFSLNEDVEFTAQVYDESFNPVSNADVSLTITNKNKKGSVNINLSSKGNGLYEGIFQTSNAGDYTYSGKAILNNNLLGKSFGKFNIGETDVELINTNLNSELLKSLSQNSKGKYFTFKERNKLIELLKSRSKNNTKEKIVTSEISLWSNKWILIIIVLLFSIEWFIRRRLSML
ncbi:MAG TPA: hypothetical protein ENI57_10880 [Ignavibacteria bacterium]|nr:hypothetical protein [Ignavibacteria bacterium]